MHIGFVSCFSSVHVLEDTAEVLLNGGKNKLFLVRWELVLQEPGAGGQRGRTPLSYRMSSWGDLDKSCRNAQCWGPCVYIFYSKKKRIPPFYFQN